MNPLDPTLLNYQERLAEIAEILAAGLIRLHARQSTRLSPDHRESLLDSTGGQSGHGETLNEGASH